MFQSLQRVPDAPLVAANNLQQSWRFDWEPPKAVLRGVWAIDWILGCWNLQLKLLQLPIGQFLVSDVGPDHFLVPANGRDKVPPRPEFVAEKIPHLAFDILRESISSPSLSCIR